MHRAAGYRRVGDQIKNQSWVAPPLNATADGSLYLSLEDWIIWLRAVRDRRVLSADSWRQMLSPVRLNSGRTYPYGFGMELPRGPGPRRLNHTGLWQAFSTAFSYHVGADVGVVALANAAEADRDAPATARARELLDTMAATGLRPEHFEFVPGGFFPAAHEAYRRRLREAGQIGSIEAIAREERGNDIYASYRIFATGDVLLLDLALGPSGKPTSLGIRKEPPLPP